MQQGDNEQRAKLRQEPKAQAPKEKRRQGRHTSTSAAAGLVDDEEEEAMPVAAPVDPWRPAVADGESVRCTNSSCSSLFILLLRPDIKAANWVAWFWSIPCCFRGIPETQRRKEKQKTENWRKKRRDHETKKNPNLLYRKSHKIWPLNVASISSTQFQDHLQLPLPLFCYRDWQSKKKARFFRLRVLRNFNTFELSRLPRYLLWFHLLGTHLFPFLRNLRFVRGYLFSFCAFNFARLFLFKSHASVFVLSISFVCCVEWRSVTAFLLYSCSSDFFAFVWCPFSHCFFFFF